MILYCERSIPVIGHNFHSSSFQNAVYIPVQVVHVPAEYLDGFGKFLIIPGGAMRVAAQDMDGPALYHFHISAPAGDRDQSLGIDL